MVYGLWCLMPLSTVGGFLRLVYYVVYVLVRGKQGTVAAWLHPDLYLRNIIFHVCCSYVDTVRIWVRAMVINAML
jgi:hypothetical protein